jgi:hypothetical protein
MIPSITHIEWSELVTGIKNVNLSSHSLRIKINILRKKIQNGNMTSELAVEELYNDCKKHYDLYKNDLFMIFPKVLI